MPYSNLYTFCIYILILSRDLMIHMYYMVYAKLHFFYCWCNFDNHFFHLFNFCFFSICWYRFYNQQTRCFFSRYFLDTFLFVILLIGYCLKTLLKFICSYLFRLAEFYSVRWPGRPFRFLLWQNASPIWAWCVQMARLWSDMRWPPSFH